jgi:hypothetical protein
MDSKDNELIALEKIHLFVEVREEKAGGERKREGEREKESRALEKMYVFVGKRIHHQLSLLDLTVLWFLAPAPAPPAPSTRTHVPHPRPLLCTCTPTRAPSCVV